MTVRFEVPLAKIPCVGERVFLDVDHRFVLLFNIENQFYAIDDSCPHQGASLFSGKLEGCTIKCCAHGLRFNLVDGYMVNSKQLKVPSYVVEQEGEQLFIIFSKGT